MISVVIPTLDSERELIASLPPLVTAAAEGIVRDVIIVDGGSMDATKDVADAVGATFFEDEGPLGARLSVGTVKAKGPWILFLSPGVALEAGWHAETCNVIETLERQGSALSHALVFRHAIDGIDVRARIRETVRRVGCFVTGIPRFEQGLLIHHAHYERLGGFRPLPAMEAADMAWRIGRMRTINLRSRAFAPAVRQRRTVMDAIGASLLLLRVPPRLIARLYG